MKKFLEVIVMPTTVSVSPSDLSQSDIYDLAERLSRQSNYITTKDIARVVEDLGGVIELTDFWEDTDTTGSLEVHGPSDFVIKIPQHTTVERDRFTIAHELGHYILHFLFKDIDDSNELPFVVNRYGSGRVEWEANWFAASFLMPRSEFKKVFAHSNRNVFAVAKQFGVSTSAATIRARALGLLSE